MLSRFLAIAALAMVVLGAALVVSVNWAPSPGDPTALVRRTISASQALFIPSVLKAPAGAPIALTFRNNSREPHTLILLAPIAAGTDQLVEPGESRTLEFIAPGPGEYVFVCNVHEGMKGTLRTQ